MKVSIFSTKSYDRQFFTAANIQHQHELIFLEPKLDRHTAILAKDATAVCVFVNDEVDKNTLEALASHSVSLIALRSAGYNIGTGKIGRVVAKIMTGFGCKVLAFDLHPNPESEKIGVEYVDLPQLFARSDIITLHCPLTPETYHLVNEEIDL